MHVKLIFKFLLLFKLLITVGCSYNRLENLGLLKEKANEYSLARKAPLIMPPDMYLRPPSSEKEEVTISNDNIEDDIIEVTEIVEEKDSKIRSGKADKKNKKTKETTISEEIAVPDDPGVVHEEDIHEP